ncbi:MAG: SLBB domain-containing protein [Prevotella sp.]|nr:SLBB domain-containing protein [Prevotella sp.]MBR3657760.1 SLBB domain-containing protein [Prevotella sp.]
MKKKLFATFLFLGLTLTAFGQSMSDTQILQYVMQQKKLGKSESDIATELLKKGATLEQIQSMRQKYAKQLEQHSMAGEADKAIDAASRMRQNNAPDQVDQQKAQQQMMQNVPDNMLYGEQTGQPAGKEYFGVEETTGKKVFGRDIFNNKNLTFEPVMNIATPQNYVLGPGDQLIIDVYGDTQRSEQLTVSPDGDVNVPDYGPVHVAGLSVSAAQNKVRSHLGTYYESSDIKVTVGQTRTILVNVMGEVKAPGTYTLSAFATVFHALYMAGGISDLGTLRNIKVYRQGRLISVVDVYEFILNGRLAGNVRLMDNDVIQVGPYESIVDIAGRVKRPMAYELRKNESLATLLKYSGNFANDAYKKSLRVFRKNGRMKSVYNVEEFEMPEFKMFDGDSVEVDSIIDRFENTVEVKGAIYRPGMYQLGEKVNSVRSLIESADGLTEEAMLSRAVIRRMKPNRTQEVLTVDLKGIIEGTAADVPLENEDILFIPIQAVHQNLRTLSIDGEVIFPGTYEYAEKMTVEDLILQAGGLTDNASTVKVDVARRMIDPEATTSTMEIAKTYSFSIKPGFEFDGDKSFTLQPYDAVSVRRSPVSVDPFRVRVEGEIAFEGFYTLEQKNQRLSDVVKAAGGVIPGAYVRGARLIRNMNEDELARRDELIKMARQSAAASAKDSLSLEQLATETTYLVGIHLDEALANPGCDEDVELQDGDRLVIPRYNRTVKISGDVQKSNTVAFKDKKNYKYYISQAGGYGKRARKSHTYILYQNGTIAKASKGDIEPGCEIVVPTKGPKDPNQITQWLGIGTSAASLATMFVSIANMLK